MQEATIREIEFAPGEMITLETGRLAKQADGAVVVRQGDTMVLCTAVISRSVREGQSFFPLTVDYREKFSAGGKIPGGFIKREGRPTDKEIMSSRLVDRAIRPLFPDGFLNEVQIICYVLSADARYDADVLAGIGASAALLLAGAPFDGPISEVRVGRVNGEFVVNPTLEQTDESDFNLIIAGKKDSIVMVEGEMNEVSEEEMVEALEVGHKAVRILCEGQTGLVEQFGSVEPFTDYTTEDIEDALSARIQKSIGHLMAEHIREPYNKATFYGGIDEMKKSVVADLLGLDDPDLGQVMGDATEEGWTASDIRAAVSKVERDAMRRMIVEDGRRIDGRGLKDVRNI